MAQAIPFIAVALTAAGTGVAVASSIQQGKDAEKAAEFNQAVARNNALAAQQASEFEASQIRRRNLIRLGQQRAAFAKSGVDLSLSVDDVIFDSAVQGELEVMSSLYSGSARATFQESRARLAEFQGQQEVRASRFNAGATLLTGGAGTATKLDNALN